MAAYGYSYVAREGYVAFVDELNGGAWGKIDIQPFRLDQPKPEQQSVLDASRLVGWKLCLGWAITNLTDQVGTVTPDELTSLDQAWDGSERRLNLQVAVHEASEDSAVAAAATRVRNALLSGAGTAQTVLAWEKEVDFGRNQVALANTAPLSADIKLLNLQPFVHDISEKSEALAAGIGRGSDKSTEPRANRIRGALVECRQAFNRVHDDIVWHRAHTTDRQKLELLNQLEAPLLGLLERYPASPAKPTEEEPPVVPEPTA